MRARSVARSSFGKGALARFTPEVKTYECMERGPPVETAMGSALALTLLVLVLVLSFSASPPPAALSLSLSLALGLVVLVVLAALI
tara:strand:+ start:313 stop:570 length:258 start_codon:yes stop_codon:yes gene_type:complete